MFKHNVCEHVTVVVEVFKFKCRTTLYSIGFGQLLIQSFVVRNVYFKDKRNCLSYNLTLPPTGESGVNETKLQVERSFRG